MLRKSGRFTPFSVVVQSNDKTLSTMDYGMFLCPTSAPIMPPTIAAFVSVSPP